MWVNKMDNEFLDMNKEAKELVNGLEKLHSEISGYKTSKQQLEDLNKTLSGFIEQTKVLSEKSAKVIEHTSKLTPSKMDSKVDEIHRRIDTLEENIANMSKSIEKMTKSVDKNSEEIKTVKRPIFGFGKK